MSDQAYPLDWPSGWKRAASRRKAQFKGRVGGIVNGTYAGAERVTLPQGVSRLKDALRRLDAGSVTISSNLRLNRDGSITQNQTMPSDPGVAVYWKVGKEIRCMAIDTYDRIPDNLAAIAATLDAMRSIERYGGAIILERAFRGFTALPAPEQPFQVLGVKAAATKTEIEAAYRALAAKHHPDRGGDSHQMARINAARDAMLE